MNKTFKALVIVAISIGGYQILSIFLLSYLTNFINGLIQNNEISQLLTQLILGLPLFGAVLLINKPSFFFESLGLKESIVKGSLISLICTLPMLIGYFFVFNFNAELTWAEILSGAVFAAFIEELFFRGILFGQLYRFTTLGFMPSISFGALIFALAHLYQSQDPLTLIGIFIATFLGAILFAWVYIEWNNNLWVPIFLHLFMNLFWMLFSAGDNAFGGILANLFRGVTIITIIYLTIQYKKYYKQKLAINKSTIWIKSN